MGCWADVNRPGRVGQGLVLSAHAHYRVLHLRATVSVGVIPLLCDPIFVAVCFRLLRHEQP